MFQYLCAILLTIIVEHVNAVEASGMQFGDGVALVLGFILVTLGILACLGKHARKLGAAQY